MYQIVNIFQDNGHCQQANIGYKCDFTLARCTDVRMVIDCAHTYKAPTHLLATSSFHVRLKGRILLQMVIGPNYVMTGLCMYVKDHK
jgi:hypothetical protein